MIRAAIAMATTRRGRCSTPHWWTWSPAGVVIAAGGQQFQPGWLDRGRCAGPGPCRRQRRTALEPSRTRRLRDRRETPFTYRHSWTSRHYAPRSAPRWVPTTDAARTSACRLLHDVGSSGCRTAFSDKPAASPTRSGARSRTSALDPPDPRARAGVRHFAWIRAAPRAPEARDPWSLAPTTRLHGTSPCRVRRVRGADRGSPVPRRHEVPDARHLGRDRGTASTRRCSTRRARSRSRACLPTSRRVPRGTACCTPCGRAPVVDSPPGPRADELLLGPALRATPMPDPARRARPRSPSRAIGWSRCAEPAARREHRARRGHRLGTFYAPQTARHRHAFVLGLLDCYCG